MLVYCSVFCLKKKKIESVFWIIFDDDVPKKKQGTNRVTLYLQKSFIFLFHFFPTSASEFFAFIQTVLVSLTMFIFLKKYILFIKESSFSQCLYSKTFESFMDLPIIKTLSFSYNLTFISKFSLT